MTTNSIKSGVWFYKELNGRLIETGRIVRYKATSKSIRFHATRVLGCYEWTADCGETWFSDLAAAYRGADVTRIDWWTD